MRTTFAVGRLTPRSAEIVILEEGRERPPFPGPWTLRAVVRRGARDPGAPGKRPRTPLRGTVH